MVKLRGIHLFSSTFYSDYWSCALKHSSVGGKRVLQSSTPPPQEAAARSTVTSVPQVAFIARLLHDIKHWSLLLFLFPDSCLWIYNFHKDVQYKICTNNFADEWFADFWCIFVIVSLLYFNVCIVFDASVSCWVCELCLVTWAHSPSRQSPCSKKDGSGQVATVFIPLWRSENSTSMGRFTNQGKLASQSTEVGGSVGDLLIYKDK